MATPKKVETLKITEILQTHHIALSAREIKKYLPHPEKIFIRDVNRDVNGGRVIYPLTDIADFPFQFKDTDKGGEISGFDRINKSIVSLRIEPNSGGIVQIKNKIHLDWTFLTSGSTRVYIPR